MTSAALNGPAHAVTGQQRQPIFWCLRCPKRDRRWRAGGASGLVAHQALHRGALKIPHFLSIDAEGFVLEGPGRRELKRRQPVPAPKSRDGQRLDGWVRSVPLVTAPPYRDAS